MLSQELEERGQQLVSELDLQNKDITQKWMAHYIAELMHRAERTDSAEERLQAADRCADIIMHLWERRAEDARRYVRSQVYSSFEALYEKRELADILGAALEAPTEQAYPRSWSARALILWHLLNVERDLLRLLIIADAIAHMEKGEAVDEAVTEFIEREERLSTIRRHLDDVFSGTLDLDVRDRRSVVRRVKLALQSIQAVREQLI